MSLGCGIGDVDVDALAVTGTNVGGDEGVCVRARVLYALFREILAGRANLMEKGRRVMYSAHFRVRLQITVRCPSRALAMLTGHLSENRRQRHEALA